MNITEDELKERAVAPRVTLEQVNETIVSEFYFTAGDGVRGESLMAVSPAGRAKTLELLTFCVLVLQNGFTVTGQSACADPANYQPDIGKRIAKQDAVSKIWSLLGYELRTKLALVDQGTPPSDTMMKTYVGTKVVHAYPMNHRRYNEVRGFKLPTDESGDDEGYLVEYADGGKPNFAPFKGYVSWSPKAVFEAAYRLVRS